MVSATSSPSGWLHFVGTGIWVQSGADVIPSSWFASLDWFQAGSANTPTGEPKKLFTETATAAQHQLFACWGCIIKGCVGALISSCSGGFMLTAREPMYPAEVAP